MRNDVGENFVHSEFDVVGRDARFCNPLDALDEGVKAGTEYIQVLIGCGKIEPEGITVQFHYAIPLMTISVWSSSCVCPAVNPSMAPYNP